MEQMTQNSKAEKINLYKESLPYVRSWAKYYSSIYPEVEKEDLLEEGKVALWTHINRGEELQALCHAKMEMERFAIGEVKQSEILSLDIRQKVGDECQELYESVTCL